MKKMTQNELKKATLSVDSLLEHIDIDSEGVKKDWIIDDKTYEKMHNMLTEAKKEGLQLALDICRQILKPYVSEADFSSTFSKPSGTPLIKACCKEIEEAIAATESDLI